MRMGNEAHADQQKQSNGAKTPLGGVDDAEVTERSPAALLARLREGDLEAGYALLGRQAPIAQWKKALELFAARADEADLERIAVSTLGRQPEVVRDVLALVARASSSRAAFIAYAASQLREEPTLRDAAERIRSEVTVGAAPRNGDDGLASLYALLARPLSELKSEWDSLRESAADAASAVVQALGEEDERLQRLSKERSYRAGSYLHFLRHRLADFALLSRPDSRLTQRAFALLQRRVDEAEEQEELLRLLDSDLRRRYLVWATDLKNAGFAPRARFALRMLRDRFPADADEGALLTLTRKAEPEVAAEAAATALAIGLGGSALDGEAARLVSELDELHARIVAGTLARAAASRVRIDLVAPDRWDLLLQDREADGQELASALAAGLDRLDPERASRLVAALEAEEPFSTLGRPFFSELLTGLLARAEQESHWWRVVDAASAGPRLQEAAWSALPACSEPTRTRLARRLLEAEPPTARVERAVAVLAALAENEAQGFAQFLLDEAVKGTFDAAELASVWPEALRGFAASRVRSRLGESEQVVAELRGRLEAGAEAYVGELRQVIGPLVERARERARGNEALAAGYGRLLATLTGAEEAPDGDREDAGVDLAQVAGELAQLGARLEQTDGHLRLAVDPKAFSDASAVRYLGALDQRVQTAGTEPGLRAASQAVVPPLVETLGELGIASRLIVDLFERGPLFPVAVGLSGATRELVLQAARNNGLEVKNTWLGHPALGEWLRSLHEDSGPPDEADVELEPLLARAQTVEAALALTRAELERQQHTVKVSLGQAASSVLDEIAVLFDSYMQLWRGLSRLGLQEAAPLGSVVPADDVDPDRHQIVGEKDRGRFLVRAPGLEVDGDVVVRARLEAID